MARIRKQYEPKHLTLSAAERHEWAERHYGIFARIGFELGFTRTYVRQVYWRIGNRHNEAVDRMLDHFVFAGRYRNRAA